MNIKDKLQNIESTLHQAKALLAVVDHNIAELRTDLRDSPSEPDYSSWVGKPVFVRDTISQKPTVCYFVKYDSKADLPCVAYRTIAQTNDLAWKYCRLIRDFEDLQRGEW